MGKILVVKTKSLLAGKNYNSFVPMDKTEIFPIIEENAEFIERDLLEEDPSYQQIIAEIVLRVNNKYFIHKIPGTGSEARLHDMWPILLGGHVDDYDDNIEAAAEREFAEEINYKGKLLSKKFIGIIKVDDGNPVNDVHTGMVWEYVGDSEDFEPTGDDGVKGGKFLSLEELREYKDKMTWWSKAVYGYLVKTRK